MITLEDSVNVELHLSHDAVSLMVENEPIFKEDIVSAVLKLHGKSPIRYIIIIKTDSQNALRLKLKYDYT